MVLFAFFHFSLQLSQSIEVAQRRAGSHVVDGRSFVLLGRTLGSARSLLHVVLTLFEGAAVREDDALGLLDELNHLEGQLLVELSLASILLHEVLGSGKAFHAILELDNGTLVEQLCDGAFVHAVHV